MERMRLTKIERLVLQELANGNDCSNVWRKAYAATRLRRDEPVKYAFHHLQEVGFVKALFVEGGKPFDARITDKGVAYIEEYPLLENLTDPLRGERFSRLISVLSIIVSVLALSVSILAVIL